MALINLASELLEVICDDLTTRDVANLRLVCKPLGESLSQVVCRYIAFSFKQSTFVRQIDRLQALVEGRWPHASRGARTLHLGSLSPRLHPDYLYPQRSYIDGAWQELPDPDPSAEVLEAEDKVKRLLPEVVASLRGIHTVEWMPCRHDEAVVQTLVGDAITTLPNLRHLIMDTTYFVAPLPISRLPPLITLDLRGNTKNVSEQARMNQVSQCVAKSHNMTSLTLYREQDDSGPSQTASLHYVFKDIDATKSPPLKLMKLTLGGFYVRFDATILPHFKNLQSLVLSDFAYPERPTPRTDGEDDGPEIDRALSSYAAPFSDIWKAFRKAGIRLSRIDVTHMSNAFVDYIWSYSGLEYLTLYVHDSDARNVDKKREDQLWEALGGNHGGSLRYIDIYPQYEGGWCFSQKRVSALGQCKKLLMLKVTVATAREASHDESSSESPCQAMTALLDTAAANMPKLDHITISATSCHSLRYALCGQPARSHFGHASEVLNKTVSEYRAPAFCQRLPHLDIEVWGGHTKWKSLLTGRSNSPGLGDDTQDNSGVPTEVPRSSTVSSFRRLLRLGKRPARQLATPMSLSRQTMLAYQQMSGNDDRNVFTIYL